MSAAPVTVSAPPSANDATGPRPRRLEAPRYSWRVEASVTAVVSSVLFVVGFGGGVGRISLPLAGGDLLPVYAAAHMWAAGSPFGDNSLGYPFGMELRYYPTGDLLQNALAGLLASVTDNPFLGMNLVFAASFPLTALAALWAFRVAGLQGPWAVLASLALTFLPYHWLRLVHLYLATSYSAVLGVGLAILVGNGTVQERLRSPSRMRFALLLLLLAVLIGASGIYYACFTVLLCAAALLYRTSRAAGWRDLLVSAVPAVAVTVVLGAVLAPAMLHSWAHPPLDPVAARSPIESVAYSGALAFLLLPAPLSRLPGSGPLNDAVTAVYADGMASPTAAVLLHSNFGSVATTAAFVVIAVGGLLVIRRAAHPGSVASERPRTSLGLLGLLSATALLFFVPWGLNFLFASLVTPQLRGWDRLVPVLFTLVLLCAGLVLQRLRLWLRPGVTAAALVVGLGVLVFDSVLPYRSFFDEAEANGGSVGQAGYAYAAELNSAVPGRCGVLQLPHLEYPEVAPKVDLDVYGHLWPALTNPDKSWSAAAMKGTAASAWQRTLGDVIDAGDVQALEAGGFCAVHVDLRGFTPENRSQVTGGLEQLLGAPVAVGSDGMWLAYALPSPRDGGVDPTRLAEAGGSVGTFYSPPTVTPGAGAPALPDVGALRTTWTLSQDRAEFALDSLPDGARFTTVVGEVDVRGCPGQEAVLTLRAGEQEETVTMPLPPGGSRPFSISLGEPIREAALAVTVSGSECASAEDGAPGGVALVDLRANG